jgi:YHS domain-containing protein
MLEMDEHEKRLRLYDDLARICMKEIALPRLEALVRTLGNASRPDVREGCNSVTISFRSTERFPIGADISLILAHDAKIENILGLWKVSIIPILIDYERESNATVGIDAPDLNRFAGFVEDRIVRFASDYLRVHEPDSPYLQIERVTDPVCGMSIPRTEAAASVSHDGKTYYFCIEGCRDLFAKDPAHYLRHVAY